MLRDVMKRRRHRDAPTRTVRVRTEVAALDKAFDYAVPARWADDVRVGTRVRVPLHGRSVRGWVVEADVDAARAASTSCRSSRGSAGDHLPRSSSWPTGRRGAGRAPPRSSCTRPPRPTSCGRCPHPPPVAGPARRPVRRDGAARGRVGRCARRARARPWCDSRRPPTSSTWCSRSLGRPGRRTPGRQPGRCWCPRRVGGAAGRRGSVRRGCPATTAWAEARAGLARRGGEPCRRLGTGAAAWPPRSCSTPTTPPTVRRARRPTARSTCCSSGPGARPSRASWSRPSRP